MICDNCLDEVGWVNIPQYLVTEQTISWEYATIGTGYFSLLRVGNNKNIIFVPECLWFPSLMAIRPGEKGIRCETGAVPAAVSSLNVFRHPLVTVSVFWDGKTSKD